MEKVPQTRYVASCELSVPIVVNSHPSSSTSRASTTTSRQPEAELAGYQITLIRQFLQNRLTILLRRTDYFLQELHPSSIGRLAVEPSSNTGNRTSRGIQRPRSGSVPPTTTAGVMTCFSRHNCSGAIRKGRPQKINLQSKLGSSI